MCMDMHGHAWMCLSDIGCAWVGYARMFMDRREPLGTIEIVEQLVPTPYTYVKFLNFFTAPGESTKYMELYGSAMDIQRLTREVDGSPTKFK